MHKILSFFKTLFLEEYEVVTWSNSTNEKKIYKFKKINKITQTSISAVKSDGKKFELQVNEPFNYQVIKVH